MNIGDFMKRVWKVNGWGDYEEFKYKQDLDRRSYYRTELNDLEEQIVDLEKQVKTLDDKLCVNSDYREIKILWKKLAFNSQRRDFMYKELIKEYERDMEDFKKIPG